VKRSKSHGGKRSRNKARPKAMSLKARKRLLETLVDSALDDMPDQDIEPIAEHLVKIGLYLVIAERDIEEDDVVMIHPTHPTTRLLNAINDHIEATNEPGDKLVERLIASLGSQAAYASQPN
jgi:hypothetical protein